MKISGNYAPMKLATAVAGSLLLMSCASEEAAEEPADAVAEEEAAPVVEEPVAEAVEEATPAGETGGEDQGGPRVPGGG